MRQQRFTQLDRLFARSSFERWLGVRDVWNPAWQPRGRWWARPSTRAAHTDAAHNPSVWRRLARPARAA
ncbi:MAG: hypothetical protein ACXWQR_19175 [Ktedonobacterales bacterium]